MEYLSGQTLVKKNRETIPADEALSDKELIGFYFSAHWCPPCRQFTPILADFYEEVREAGNPFEIIFVSSDRSEENLFDYMKEAHGDWLALPFGSNAIQQLQKHFAISGIPAFIIVKKDGTVVSTNGRKEVQNNGAQAYKEWSK